MDLSRIRQKLESVQQSGTACFGSNNHDFQLKPPVPLGEIEAFERAQGFALPEDYRAFISTLGGSGAGPYYGLLPLSEWDSGHLYLEKLGGNAVTLVDMGCNNYGLLLTTGERRGRVVYTSDEGTLTFPDNPDFVSWYERWLDELLWGYDIAWFGFGMAGGEADFLKALQDESLNRRRDGVAAMARLPRLSVESRDALLAALADEPTIASGAVFVLAKLDLPALEPALPKLVHHQNPEVRLEAMRALPRTVHAGLTAQFVNSDVPEIARLAVQSADVSDAQLSELLDGPLWESAIMQLRTRSSATSVPKLISMIEDEDFERRRAAIVCLRIRKEASARNALHERFPREPTLELRQQVVEALGAVGDFDAVLGFAQHEEAGLRFRAVYALGELADARAIPVLEKLTTDTAKPPGSAWPIAEQARRALLKLKAIS
jgi:HEAT repeat protein